MMSQQKIIPFNQQIAFLLAVLVALTIGACSQNSQPQTSVSVDKPFVRSTPPGHKVTSAFMQLNNHTSTDISLVAANSSVAGITEIHQTSEQDGVMRMQHINAIRIPAKGSTELKPGGLHVMLMDLQQPLKEGETIQIELMFSDQSSQTITAPVVKAVR